MSLNTIKRLSTDELLARVTQAHQPRSAIRDEIGHRIHVAARRLAEIEPPTPTRDEFANHLRATSEDAEWSVAERIAIQALANALDGHEMTPEVRAAYDAYDVQFHAYKRGEGRYPSSSGIVAALIASARVADVLASPTTETPPAPDSAAPLVLEGDRE